MSVLSPEFLLYMRNSVYSDTIEAKLSDMILYPIVQVSVYELVLLVQIRQSMKPTVLQLLFALPVCYQTIRMVILRLVERYSRILTPYLRHRSNLRPID